METVEYWHAEEFTTDVRATANDLKDELCYDPLALTEGSVSLFHRRMTVDWVRGVSLVTGRATWLPADAARLNLRLGNTWAPPLFNMDTNGLASGNTVYEAALHGLYEIMERHCMYLADDESPRFIDPLSVDDPVLAPLFQSVLRNNECVIRDVTLWPEYPCYQVGIRSPYLISGFGGSGLHTRASVSLSRALTEAAQSRLTTISGSREDIADEEYMYLAKPLETPPLVRDEVRNLEPWISVQDEAGNFSVSEHMREAAMFIHAITGHEPVAAVLRRGPSQAAVVKVLAPGLGVEAQLNRRVPLVGERT
jgi:ribosomal protein S12 methylthiotransferase accessory factor